MHLHKPLFPSVPHGQTVCQLICELGDSPAIVSSTARLLYNIARAVAVYVLLRSQADAGRDLTTALASLQTRWCHSVLRHSDSLDRHGHPL